MPVPVAKVSATVDVTRTNPVVQVTTRPNGVSITAGPNVTTNAPVQIVEAAAWAGLTKNPGTVYVVKGTGVYVGDVLAASV